MIKSREDQCKFRMYSRFQSEGHHHHSHPVPDTHPSTVRAQRAAVDRDRLGRAILLSHLDLLCALLEHHCPVEILYVQCSVGCQQLDLRRDEQQRGDSCLPRPGLSTASYCSTVIAYKRMFISI